MTNYNEFQFSVDVPQALIDAGGPLLATDNDYDKTAAVVEVATHEDGTVQTAIISTHSRLDLATKKASKLARDVSKVAGGNAVDYLPVDIELVPRNKTYFGTDGEYGNAEDLLILDTSSWTPQMWRRMQWTRAYGRELATHFDAKVHTFEERREYALDPVTKAWGYVTVMGCSFCFLKEKDLNL